MSQQRCVHAVMLSKVLAWDPLLPTPLQLRGTILTSIWQDLHFAKSTAAGSLACSRAQMIAVYYPIAAALRLQIAKLLIHQNGVNVKNKEILGTFASSDKRARAAPAALLISHQYPEQASRRLGRVSFDVPQFLSI